MWSDRDWVDINECMFQDAPCHEKSTLQNTASSCSIL
jgi:hypothetical protein